MVGTGKNIHLEGSYRERRRILGRERTHRVGKKSAREVLYCLKKMLWGEILGTGTEEKYAGDNKYSD